MTVQAQAGGVLYAGFWRRVLAYIVDAIVIGIASGVVNFALTMILGLLGLAVDPNTLDPNDPAAQKTLMIVGVAMIGIILPISIVGQWLYFALMESSSNQGTLGKMALQLKVTGLDGNRITFGRATGRYFAKYISALVLLIGFIMVGLSARKQGLHDKIAGSLVIRVPV